MNKKNKFLVLLLSMVFIISAFTACEPEQVDATFDATGYIQAFLDNSYKGEGDAYMAHAGATIEEVNDAYEATINNAVVKFFEKYELNPDEIQTDRLSGIFKLALSQAVYTANPKEDTADGYSVSVTYTPIISFENLEIQISEVKGTAGETLYDTGAVFIDQVIDLCETASQSVQNGQTSVIDFNLRVDEEGKVFLDISTFDELDDLILVI